MTIPHSIRLAVNARTRRLSPEAARTLSVASVFTRPLPFRALHALAELPDTVTAPFAGVGNPHLRSRLQAGDVVVDVGSGAGLDSIIAGWQVGASGRVIGVDLNPEMLTRAAQHASQAGVGTVEFRKGRMEALPVDDRTANVVISNGVINLSFQKRTVFHQLFRVLKPGGRISITDIVSAKQLKQSIVNDPKLWAS